MCERITSSSQQVTTSTKVDELLTQAKSVWEDVKGSVDVSIPKVSYEFHVVCRVGSVDECWLWIGLLFFI